MNELLNTKESAKAEQNWISKQELMDICKCSDKTLEQIVSSLSIETGFDTQNHIKKGGYHNSEVFYDDDFLVAVITDKVKHNTNQKTDTIKKDKEQGILLNTVINSGNLKAAKELCDLIMAKAEIQAEIKKKSEQIKQIENMKDCLNKWYNQHNTDDYTETFYDSLLRDTEKYLWGDSVNDL